MVDLWKILDRGGAERLALLRYCVLSVTMEPLFVYLVQEYRYRPAHAAALALFDVFCAQQAPARLRAYELLPPRALRVQAAIAAVRAQWAQMQLAESPPEDTAVRIATPARTLFDEIERGVQQDASGRLARLRRAYDPQRTPEENLPGGKLNEGQRQFVERVWQPVVKPRLVAAGFWRVETVA